MESLSPGESVMSEDGRFLLTYQLDGNLALMQTTIWATKTSNTAGRALLQGDGDVVLYNAIGAPYWSTATGNKGAPPFRLVLQTDRNLVLYASDRILWTSGTQEEAFAVSDDTMAINQELRPGESMRSQDGRFVLIYQPDGNLVLYPTTVMYLNTPNQNQTPGRALLQADGNFVLYNASGLAYWSSKTPSENNDPSDPDAPPPKFTLSIGRSRVEIWSSKATLNFDRFGGKGTYSYGSWLRVWTSPELAS
ncbi:Mannose-specific lectin [Tetrabaena socialis]|uniref:Mannose-specific lectin n=1 Tax=Tetrabaena socialis TaxID=47790 RepID=A0A2J7ZLV1_9CHLO|nr:Mannose-specific lectin [Tetrabaena socialis]|eukprot:PNH01242.1 Mannose-specific lectin [Tetrabaena socialis]